MIKTRLIGLVPDSKKYIAANVLMQWIGLCSNAFMIITIARMLDSLQVGIVPDMAAAGITIALCALVRVVCVKVFYNIGAIALAAVLTYIVKWDKSSVLAFGYAFLSYPLAMLSGKLFSKTTVEVGIVELLLILMLTGALSLLGTLVGKWIAEKGANKA